MYRKGDVVFVKFPYSDLSGYKERPALIVWAGNAGQQDYLLVQITSVIDRNDGLSFAIEPTDFQVGYLPKPGMIRAHKLFTANKTIITRYAGTITDLFRQQVTDSLKALLDN